MSLKEYKPGQAFPGVIGRTFDVSKPAWPAPNRAKENGASFHLAPMTMEGVGRMAVIADPQGAVFALFQPSQHS